MILTNAPKCFLQFYRSIFIALAIVCFSSLAFSQEYKIGLHPQNKLTELYITHWNTESGLPSNSVNDIFQAKDGFIWIATFESFLKFDGINLTPIKDVNGITEARLVGGNAISQGSDGKIWLSSVGLGAVNYEKSKFNLIEGMSNTSVARVFEDSQKKIWIGTINFGIFTYDGKILSKTNYSEISDVTISNIIEDKSGGIWIATEGKGLTYLQNEEHRTFTTKTGLNTNSVICIYPDEEGNIWIGTANGLNIYSNGRISEIPDVSGFSVREIIGDDYGNLWIATTNGLYRRNALSKKLENLSVENGLPDRDLNNLTFDNEGNLWVGSTRNGMFQLRQTSFHAVGQKEGYKIDKMNIVSEIEPGSFLMGDDNGKIYSFKNNKFEQLNFRTKKLLNQRIRDIYKDSAGNIWISTYAGVLRINNGKEVFLTVDSGLSSNQTRVIFEDKQGYIWIGSRNGGLNKLDKSGEVLKVINKSNGLSSDFVMSIDMDKEGNLYVGTVGGGLNIIDSNGRITSYVDDNGGILKDVIFNSYIDKDGAVWICNNYGITRLLDGKMTSITKKEGIKIDRSFDFQEDNMGYVWVSSSKGIIRILKKELNAYLDGNPKKPNVRLFDKFDGMPSTQCIAPTESLKSSDGRLWFPTEKGVAIINPIKVIKNEIKPPVHVEQVIVDNKVTHDVTYMELTPSTKRMEFSFNALSYVTPEKVKFKYMLEGFDQDWITPEHKERYIIYTNLSHGNYTFKVKGTNNQGLWNEEGASFSFYIKPYFYETNLFYFLSLLFISLSIYGGIRWRTSQIKKKSIILQRIVDKRTIEIREQQEEIIQQRDNLEVSYKSVKRLSDIGKQITSCLSVNAILNTSYENLNQLMKAPNFAIGIYDEDSESLKFFGKEVNEDNILTGKDSLEDESTFSVWCFKNQREIFINDLQKEIFEYNPVTFHHKNSINSLIYLPLRTKEKNIGVITVQDFNKNSYTDYHLNIFKNLALSVSIALENAYVYEQIKVQKIEIENQSKELKEAHQLIQNKNEELSNTNQILEDKVFKRTYELRKTMKELDLYIYRSAHDLNGPVARIAGLCNLLKKEENSEMKDVYIDMMYQNSVDMKKLLDKLMRIQVSKNKPLNIQKIDIEKLFNDLFASFSWHPNYDKIHFNVILKGKINFQSDVSLVSHLFENLIDNSLNYIDPSKIENYINIEVFQGGDKECRFTIKDNGMGISKDVSGKIFTMFYRGSENSKGFGLGLFESKMIARKLKGKLWFKKSNKLDTEFLVFLPSGILQKEVLEKANKTV